MGHKLCCWCWLRYSYLLWLLAVDDCTCSLHFYWRQAFHASLTFLLHWRIFSGGQSLPVPIFRGTAGPQFLHHYRKTGDFYEHEIVPYICSRWPTTEMFFHPLSYNCMFVCSHLYYLHVRKMSSTICDPLWENPAVSGIINFVVFCTLFLLCTVSMVATSYGWKR